MDRIKESFDSLPIAACFFDKNGVVRLINRRMLAIANWLQKAVYSRWQRCKALCRRRRQACAVWIRAFGFTVFRTEQRCALHRSRSQQKRASDIRKSLPQTLRS